MVSIIMPQIGQDIKTGKILEWRKKENEQVNKGEVILVVESEKATFDVESDESGVLLKILFHEGEEVEVLSTIGYIGEPGESYEEKKHILYSKTTSTPHTTPGSGKELKASPAARRMAREKGVSLGAVSGSGPGGRIIKEDVIAALKDLDQSNQAMPSNTS